MEKKAQILNHLIVDSLLLQEEAVQDGITKVDLEARFMAMHQYNIIMYLLPMVVIKLEDWNRDKEYDRLGLEEQYTEFLGNKVVCHQIPIRPGRNLAIIVESAAVNYRQKKMGYNAARELYNRVQQNLARRDDEE